MRPIAPLYPSHRCRRRSRIKEAVHCALAGVLATGALAHAATPGPVPAASAGPVIDTLDSVLVSARIARHKKDFGSSETVKTLDRDQISASSVVGGAAQAMMLVPGVSVSSYGATGSQKTTISIDGIKTGWAGFSGGNPDNGSIEPTFDGVPMNNPGNDLWQATLIPQTSILQTISVTYGPGQVKDRWWTNIGGSINFVPLQPSGRFGGHVAVTYGSYQTKNESFDLQTGDIGGWRTVIAGGWNQAHNFLRGYDGYDNPSYNYAYYLKSRHRFASGDGDLSIGAYVARASAQRPFPIPVTPIPGTYITGPGTPGPLISQQTTGFYTTLPYSVNWKVDVNAIEMLWSKLNVRLSSITSVHNLVYFDHEHRLHFTPLHDYLPPRQSSWEINRPSTHVLGDKLSFDLALPHDAVAVGGYLQVSQYYSQEQLYYPYENFSQAGAIGPPAPAGLLGSPTTAQGPYDSDIFNQLNADLFVQDTIAPISTLRVTPGFREVNYTIDFYPNETSVFPLATEYNPCGDLSQINPPNECSTGVYTPAEAVNPSPTAHKSFFKGEPFIGVNWRALPWLALYANYGWSYRYPENGGGTGPYVTIAASSVHLEKGADTIAGFKIHKRRWGPVTDMELDMSYSHLDFTNETIPSALAAGGALLAFGSSVYNGVNIFGDASPLHDFYVFGNVGIVSARFSRYINGNTDANGNLIVYHNVPVPYTPTANMSFGAYYIADVGGVLVEPRLTYLRTGPQYAFDNNNNITASGVLGDSYVGPAGNTIDTSSVDIPSYSLLNFSASVDFPTSWTGMRNVKAAIQVDNLANRKYNAFEYVTSGGLYNSVGGPVIAFPGAPRAWYVTLTASF